MSGLEDVEEWESLEMAVDSGASATVIGEHQVRAVAARNPRPDIKYEVADGTHIANMGKTFGACTDDGAILRLNAQVTEVNKALLSVAKIVSVGNRVVFEKGGSYIEDTNSGEWNPLGEKNGNYILRRWVHKNQSHPFERQVQ